MYQYITIRLYTEKETGTMRNPEMVPRISHGYLRTFSEFHKFMPYLNPLRPDVAIWQHFANIILGFISK
jgi:hypothetical protein